MSELDEPLPRRLGRTGATLADALGLHTVGDLLRHYPRRYVERGELTDLADLRVGEHVTVQARVAQVRHRKTRDGRPFLDVTVTDGCRTLLLRFFGPAWRGRQLVPGRTAFFAGRVELFGTRQLTNPEMALLGEGDAEDFAGGLVPIYPASAKVSTWKIARSVRIVLEPLGELDDPLPAPLRRRQRLPSLRDALVAIHRPGSWADVRRATHRLTWDEACVLQAALAQRRVAAGRARATPRPSRPGGLLDAFDARLPFSLTAGQRAVGERIAAELARPHPMHRLLQGEVGSGKTVVALRAMLTVVDGGGQAALLAPTEVLAAQHVRSLRELLGALGCAGELGAADVATRVALLTGSLGAAARRTALDQVAAGEAGIVVGTHALLEEDVAFADLGLVVIDEQHRFGVEQREALRAKGGSPPHVLVMTATPIPRTVAMTVFGDLETSALTELPGGRSPIETHVVAATENPRWLDRVWQRLREEAAAGRQAFVVCPRVGTAAGEDDAEDPMSRDDDASGGRRPGVGVLDVLPRLLDGPLAGLRVAALHGRLPAEEKDGVMRRFAAGSLDVLVATTVIEVGVDVPNATVMIVLDADRFGVSQLHQLRGRVGRGRACGLCLLVTDLPAGASAHRRLDAVAATLDGFALARLDLEQRREGDVLGAAQSGRRSHLRLLRLLRDEELIAAARAESSALVDTDPDLAAHPALAAAIAAALDPDRVEYLQKA